jgi:transcriptional regulator with XRE-family HTH domain
MTKTKSFGELARKAKADPSRRARIAAHKRAIDDALALAALRNERGATQHQLAQALGTSQANVSRVEHQEDVYLSTLRGYVEGLGGALEINAVFPDQTVALVARSGDTEVMDRPLARRR